ncbi:DUF3644 domain-containing protein [Legionella pneumophila serogroup 1]|nr:DUF3644 domain-containing protein [Legionella pneumophila]HCJ4404766.1 DUF3644 domain-containing protein [Legionella pneumophila]HDV6761986.1 DUF3644 domain-containing protein [Legionella pneumophila]
MKKGKAKSILTAAIDSALLAVEIYNKPRATFRTEAFISLMIMAWTRLFHCYFFREIGEKYYYKQKNSIRYKRIDGEKMAWELSKCISEYGQISEAVVANLKFFIRLRNKVEHRHIEKVEFDTLIFGECQALLYNFESQLIEWFGQEYSLNETLAFSLQFSILRDKNQVLASKRVLSSEVADLKKFIENYRNSLSNDVFNSSSYSVKLIQIPKISNTHRNDLAIEFVNWSALDQVDKDSYDKLTTIIKDKIVHQPVVNSGCIKATRVCEIVREKCGIEFSHYDHKCFYVIFSIRPESLSNEDPFDTNTNYCLYDGLHNDYVYQESWAILIAKIINSDGLKRWKWKNTYKAHSRLKLENYIK